jgi:hypothetical protein
MQRRLIAGLLLAGCALAYTAGQAHSSGLREWRDRWASEEEEVTRIAPVYLKIAPTNNLSFTTFENPRADEGFTFYATGFIAPREHELKYPSGLGLNAVSLTFGGEPETGSFDPPLPIETAVQLRTTVGSAFGGTQSLVLVGFYDLTAPTVESAGRAR